MSLHSRRSTDWRSSASSVSIRIVRRQPQSFHHCSVAEAQLQSLSICKTIVELLSPSQPDASITSAAVADVAITTVRLILKAAAAVVGGKKINGCESRTEHCDDLIKSPRLTPTQSTCLNSIIGSSFAEIHKFLPMLVNFF